MKWGILVALAPLVVLLAQTPGPVVQVFQRDSGDQLVAVAPDHAMADGERFMVQIDTDWVKGDQGTLDLSWDHRLEWFTVGSATCAGGPDPGYSQTCPTGSLGGQPAGPDRVWVWFVYHQKDGQNGPLGFQATYGGQTQALAIPVAPSRASYVLRLPAFYH